MLRIIFGDSKQLTLFELAPFPSAGAELMLLLAVQLVDSVPANWAERLRYGTEGFSAPLVFCRFEKVLEKVSVE